MIKLNGQSGKILCGAIVTSSLTACSTSALGGSYAANAVRQGSNVVKNSSFSCKQFICNNWGKLLGSILIVAFLIWYFSSSGDSNDFATESDFDEAYKALLELQKKYGKNIERANEEEKNIFYFRVSQPKDSKSSRYI